MVQVKIADANFEAVLKNTKDTIMLVGSSGRIMGHFTPLPRETMYPQISDEELERRMEDTTSICYTTEEVLEKLRAL